MLKDCEQRAIAKQLEKIQAYLERVKKSLDKLEEDVDRNSDAARKIKVTYEQSA